VRRERNSDIETGREERKIEIERVTQRKKRERGKECNIEAEWTG